ncbi:PENTATRICOPEPTIDE REPEAT-CONTAINING PROTEIN MRL1 CHLOROPLASTIC [Salix koriyanagi]|uniref:PENTATRICOPEPTIDE REPEAT-CONTAINING PROTEIN MRL1 CHLOROPLASTIC n=1 Tax=Salix koriyanagi TaxID=2511006 RepID=A0A9Q0V0U6_9ROSI|nr:PENTATRICOPEPTIDE REPEAT-CONTAINING PROTEIN MRL1 CHLOROPLASTIC [Salix koriyanagi]
MELAKSQALTLTQISTLTSINQGGHRQLIGSTGHNLIRRPSGAGLLLRYRGRKLRAQRNGNKRLLVKASLDANSVLVVVAVTAFSALSLAYFYRHINSNIKNRRKITSRSIQVLGSPSFAFSQLGRSIVSQITGSHFLHFGGLHGEAREVEIQGSVEKASENSHEFEGKETHVQFQETASLHDSSRLIKAVESSGANFVAANFCDNVVVEDSEVGDGRISPLPSELSESGSASPLIFATQMTELTLEKSGEEIEFGSEMFESVVQVKSDAVLVPVDNESTEKAELSSLNGAISQSVREDLYTFYGANQSVVKSASNLGIKETSSHASLRKSKRFSSLKMNTGLETEDLSSQQPLQAADHVKKTMPLAHYAGSFHKNHPPEEYNAYNRLLREGRLAECLDLLEDMERRGLLDMNKVYHAKFFKLCRSQKAVKEAFCFCKLVQNPTLSTFNMLMSVCATSQNSAGAFEVLQLAKDVGLKADCKLYTTLISTCAKSGKVDAMFEVFHEMVNAGVEPNVHTYGALIDGCARAGQVAKAFGAYGIMRSKNVKPDRVVFNALITACGQSGAVDRAFDVLAEMTGEVQPIDPDHITIGALMKACTNSGQVDRAQEVYNMVHKYNIKGTPEVYTIAVSSCSQIGDWEFACKVYDDMTRIGVIPDEMFLSALIDVAGHAGKMDAAFEIIQEAKAKGAQLGIIPYSSLMGACCNAKNWQRGLELYEDIKCLKLKPTVATMNALITALCDGDQLSMALEVFSEMKVWGLRPNTITYSILSVASERKDDLNAGLMLLSQAKKECVPPTLIMGKCIIGMCLRKFENACTLGEPVLSFNSGRAQIENKWTSLALVVYRETIAAGEKPTIELVSQLLGCLQLPCDATLKNRLVENLGVTAVSSRNFNLCSLVDGFGEYDPRAFSLLEEAASHGIVPCVSFKESPIVIDAKQLKIHIAEVYFLTILKGLKHRLAAGAKLPNVTILLPVEKAQIITLEGEKTINVAGRISQAVASLLRRLGLPYQGNESFGKIRINGISLRRWLQPKLDSPFSGKPGEWGTSQSRLGKEISFQQRNIRTGDFSLE